MEHTNGIRATLVRIDNALMSKLIDGSIEAITIPSGVSLREAAFRSYKNLKSVKLPNTLKLIPRLAFAECESLESVYIPVGVTDIEASAFSGCEKLGTLVLPASISHIDNTAFESTEISDIYVPWGEDAIANEPWGALGAEIHHDSGGSGGLGYNGSICTGIELYVTPYIIIASAHNGSVIDSIAHLAFRDKTIRTVNIPATVQSVGNYAFLGCEYLSSVTFGARRKLLTIGGGAFANCNSLEKVYITDLSEWFNISFAGQMANPLHTGASLMVNGVQLRDLVVPEEVTAIGQYAFYQASGLQSVTLHDGVQSVGTEAFNGCQNVTRVVLSKNLKVISRHAFWLCRIYHDIEIPATVTDIGKRAFGPNAYGMKRVTFKGTPTGTINSLAFESAHITDIFVPWRKGAVANAPWGATNATIHYDWKG